MCKKGSICIRDSFYHKACILSAADQGTVFAVTLRRNLDSRLRSASSSKSRGLDRATNVTRRYNLPPILTPERLAVVHWKRAKWDHSLSVKMSRRNHPREAAAVITSFWQKRYGEVKRAHTCCCGVYLVFRKESVFGMIYPHPNRTIVYWAV